jgi:arginyl-tRNA synthetase
MINAEQYLNNAIVLALKEVFSISQNSVILQKTRKEFEGDFTLVAFPYIKEAKKSPEQFGQELGAYLQANNVDITAFNVVKGFLNISLSNAFWMHYFNAIRANKQFGLQAENSSGRTIMLEYSSPNTNKPLHLGHIRNNLLGASVANILKAAGHQVIKANLINDRGIHICKSMLAWKKYGNGETPVTNGIKGDHLVGKYYVAFDKAYKQEMEVLINAGKTKEEAEKQAPLMLECQELLRQWEAGNEDVISLWKTMNSWVYEGFSKTYNTLGVSFDKMYYESNTYLLGKELVQEGLTKNVFYKKENGSVAIDLSKEGLDEKVVLRSDGTSVYITQDLGTAIERFKEFPQLKQLIYTVGNEQDYHFKVLFKILEKLGYTWASECYHLSYGMVELPNGKMKSREGTVVDADDLLDEMFATALEKCKESDKLKHLNEEELNTVSKVVGSAALKYFMLKVDPKKKMLFDPSESVDFDGNTGPFIQYTYARTQSLLDKANTDLQKDTNIEFNAFEKEVITGLYDFENVIKESAGLYNPALIANYLYELSKSFNRFWHECQILKEENQELRLFRLQLANLAATTISNGMSLLGIEVPNRM